MAECGGKSPQIVFAHGVDLSAVSESIARFLLTNQGQICSVGSRLLVQRSIEKEMLEWICSYFKQIAMGGAMDVKPRSVRWPRPGSAVGSCNISTRHKGRGPSWS